MKYSLVENLTTEAAASPTFSFVYAYVYNNNNNDYKKIWIIITVNILFKWYDK